MVKEAKALPSTPSMLPCVHLHDVNVPACLGPYSQWGWWTSTQPVPPTPLPSPPEACSNGWSPQDYTWSVIQSRGGQGKVCMQKERLELLCLVKFMRKIALVCCCSLYSGATVMTFQIPYSDVQLVTISYPACWAHKCTSTRCMGRQKVGSNHLTDEWSQL